MCLGLVAQLASSSCIVGDDKCGANQVELTGADQAGCRCAEGAAPDPSGHGCIMCGQHEHVVAEKCECETGFTRAAAGMACEEVTGGVLGAACSADTPCADPYPYCASANGQSFCTTQGCTSQGQCPVGWVCDAPGPAGFCRQPTGLGKSCTKSSDCAGGEATFCETFVTMTCIVEKCASNPGLCPSGNVCCDMAALIGTSVCTPATVLMNGLCPDQKAPVSP
jgi:hypothetical protein